ncbi:MAG: hypothetical protein GYB68_03890 [Chloroflexi bacterium]|nr:hypothetical protein [Chloroflexota bacterium]
MSILHLNDEIALAVTEAGPLELLDTRNFHIVANDTSSFVYAVPLGDGRRSYNHVVASFMTDPDTLSWNAEKVADNILGGTAQMESHSEEWHVSADSDQQKIVWHRQSDEKISLRLRVPRQSTILEFWHTGKAEQIINGAVPGIGDENRRDLTCPSERELLFYSVNPRNCLLLQFSRPGQITIKKSDILMPAVAGTPVWEIEAGEMPPEAEGLRNLPNKPERQASEEDRTRCNTWEMTWEADELGDVEITIYQGIVQVARHFEGRLPFRIPDVSADFGAFFYQMILGTLPLNLRLLEGNLRAPRANVLMGKVAAYLDAWTRDVTFGYESFSNVDPIGVAALAAEYIQLLEKYSQSDHRDKSPVPGFISRLVPEHPPASEDYWDDAAPELLMLGGLHFRLTGDIHFAHAHRPLYQRCADFILSRIRPGEALPITTGTWDAQGVLVGKEPYYTAECVLALSRFSEILDALGEADSAQSYREAAVRMKKQANRDYQDGGFWHPERKTYINHIDHKPPHLLSPRTESWVYGDPEEEGRPRTEFALYETIFPIWLGLLDDEERIEQAIEWIDTTYSYAWGRGGATFPPFYQQNFIAFLDVGVRQRYNLPNAERLLQVILGQALAGGIPVTEWPFGTYRITGSPDWEMPFYPHTHAGRIWDNAPYFSLIINLHYGLRYTHEGWHLFDPKPFSAYPLTSFLGLRYHDAVYDLRWTGTGRIAHIMVDGQAWPTRRLDHRNGTHDVEIVLK